MRHISKLITIILLDVSLLFSAEGMWLLDQIGDLDLAAVGIELTAAEIYTPGEPCIAEGVIKLGGGTASFISPDGLVLTNHHVAFGAVQRASTRGPDFLTNGFLAETREQEIEAPGYYALSLQAMRDVSTEVTAVAEGIEDPVERAKLIRAKITAMTDAIEAQGEDLQAEIKAMYFGKQYYLFVHKRFDDIRVVYMPPSSIGNYGGDIDNWMWPRHTGDFAFVRVYVSPEGVGRSYNSENVPYHPRTWLKVAQDDLNAGDPTFIIGYPGHNTRYRTSYDIRHHQEKYYPDQINLYRNIIALLDSVGMDSPQAAIKVAGKTKGLNNYMKKYTGLLAGMERCDFLNQQLAHETEVQQTLNKKRKLRREYGELLSDYGELYEQMEARYDYDQTLALFDRLAGTLPGLANKLYYTVKEREKTEAERDPKFSETDVERYLSHLKYDFYSYYEPAQLEVLKYALDNVAALVGDKRIIGLDYLVNDENRDETLKAMLAETKLVDPDYAVSLFDFPATEIEALTDPLIQMAIKLYPAMEEKRQYHQDFSARVQDLRRQYFNLLGEFGETGLYSEANSTIRFTYGPVAGYQPRDAVHYLPFTTVEGMLDKDTGVNPFDVPPVLKDLINNRDFGRWSDPSEGTVTIAFTHACDITNGNSGSPVLNGKGELIGCAFDGNYEALLSDWKYDPAIQRTISVDIRYVMLITEKFAHASHILAEMGLE